MSEIKNISLDILQKYDLNIKKYIDDNDILKTKRTSFNEQSETFSLEGIKYLKIVDIIKESSESVVMGYFNNDTEIFYPINSGFVLDVAEYSSVYFLIDKNEECLINFELIKDNLSDFIVPIPTDLDNGKVLTVVEGKPKWNDSPAGQANLTDMVFSIIGTLPEEESDNGEEA